ncbi:MAG: Methyltransferase type 12, partial [uncultured Ramlibacter sp.]
LCHAHHRRHRSRLHRRDGQPGQQARALQGTGRRRPLERPRSCGARGLLRALCPRVAERAGRIRLHRLPRGERDLRALARAGAGAGRRGQPLLHPACLERAGFDVVRRGQGAGRLPHRQGRGLGRAPRAHGVRRGRLLPQWLQGQPGAAVAAGPGRRGAAARSRDRSRRHRLRTRPLHHADGAGLPALALPWLRHACGLHHRGPPKCQRGRPGRPRTLRLGHGHQLPRSPVRADLLLRRAARPGRPGGRRAPCRKDAGTGRNRAAGRAVRQRPRRGQPRHRRPAVLQRVGRDLLRARDQRGRADGAGRAGRAGPAARRLPQGRLLALPARRGDALQPDLRGATV